MSVPSQVRMPKKVPMTTTKGFGTALIQYARKSVTGRAGRKPKRSPLNTPLDGLIISAGMVVMPPTKCFPCVRAYLTIALSGEQADCPFVMRPSCLHCIKYMLPVLHCQVLMLSHLLFI